MDINLGNQNLPLGGTLTIYMFMLNVGPRDIIPTQANFTTSSGVTVTEEDLFFDISELDSSYDPYTIKQSSTSLEDYITQIESNLSHASAFNRNIESLEVGDVFLKKIIVYSETDGSLASLNINMGFMADISHNDTSILTVYQEINQTDPTWKKYGYNALLNSSATKLENNNLSALATAVNNADQLGNANISGLGASENSLTNYYEQDDYFEAVVYKDIDLINIDIATREPIGKLSDINYNFEWYGGTVTLPADTTLASGRVLTAEQTFTVDVYTYYPTMYIRRWLKGTKQYISLSDTNFVGAVEINNYYVATFESTIFNPNGDVATNSSGAIIPRSYIFDYTPLTDGSASFTHTYYFPNGTTVSGYTTPTSQDQMLAWASNLTTDWANSGLTSAEGYLPIASIAQGENYVAYVYNYLYLIKYANNDAQSTVGRGNSYSYSVVNGSSKTSTTPSGTSITTSGKGNNAYFEAQKGGGTIGCYGTANSSYTHTNYDLSYGYDFSSYTDTISNNSNGKTGLYATQFLTYNTGKKRVLLDGYVGSDGYTSVFCLGQVNAWGNVWTWVFGNVVNGTSTTDENGTTNYSIWLNTTFDNYDGSNWYTSSSASTIQTLTSGKYN